MKTMQDYRKMQQNDRDMLEGCWNRIHVSDDPEEVKHLQKCAHAYIKTLKDRQALIIGLDAESVEKFGIAPTKGCARPEGVDFKACLTVLSRSFNQKDVDEFAYLAGGLVDLGYDGRLYAYETMPEPIHE